MTELALGTVCNGEDEFGDEPIALILKDEPKSIFEDKELARMMASHIINIYDTKGTQTAVYFGDECPDFIPVIHAVDLYKREHFKTAVSRGWLGDFAPIEKEITEYVLNHLNGKK
jgi:hypothetical protein